MGSCMSCLGPCQIFDNHVTSVFSVPSCQQNQMSVQIPFRFPDISTRPFIGLVDMLRPTVVEQIDQITQETELTHSAAMELF